MTKNIFIALIISCTFSQLIHGTGAKKPTTGATHANKLPLQIATFIGNEEQLQECFTLCESIRKFAGPMSEAPIWIYVPEYLEKSSDRYRHTFADLTVILKILKIPPEALRYDLGIKPFIAARAEAECMGTAEILVFLDPNVIVVKPPTDLLLPKNKVFGYRPVIHKNIGSLYSEKPDSFWSRIYTLMKTDETSIFPMETVADKKIIRPYFNAGLVAVRPERGIFNKWAESFQLLYQDSTINSICRTESYRIFLHQAALASAVINIVMPREYLLLPSTYNYPLFFDHFYRSDIRFRSLDDAVTLKCEITRNRLPADWHKDLIGPSEIIDWLKARL